MSKIINIRSLEEIGTAAQEFVQYISSSDLQSNIFAFFGQMGAGKTTFIKAICKELGVADDVNSPYHFDFYRINKITEAYDIGIDEYFSGDGLCLIEWPEKIQEILPDDCFQVFVYVDDEGNRTIEIDDNQPQLD